MSRIVVVGGINMDLHLFHVTRSTGHAPFVADRYIAQPGGKGANVARAAARLGVEVALVGRVGDDEFGRDCLAAVSADGVDTNHVAVAAGHATGFVAIELTDGHHRSLVFAAGANDQLCWEDIEPGLDGLGPSDIIITQAEIPTAPLDRLAAHAARTRTPLFLDPTPPDRVSRQLLASAEVITPDMAEAALLTGRNHTSQLWPELAAQELLDAGATRVIIKTDATGALLADEHGVAQIPTLAVDAGDETGAGDVFLAALAVRRLEGAGWETSTRFANAASALSFATTGLTLPAREHVDRTVDKINGRTTDPSPR
jgi:ribokinase